MNIEMDQEGFFWPKKRLDGLDDYDPHLLDLTGDGRVSLYYGEYTQEEAMQAVQALGGIEQLLGLASNLGEVLTIYHSPFGFEDTGGWIVGGL